MLADGVMTSQSYGSASQLTGMRYTLRSDILGSFSYDAFGRRTSKTVTGTTTNFLYDAVNPVQELSGSTPTANLLTGLGVDEIFTRTDSAGAGNFLTDALGSTLALADSSGKVQTNCSYEPFGKNTVTGTASTNSFRYTGREDDGTGVYFYRARYYHPTLQRFISEDPIGLLSGDVNFYPYAHENPVTLTDPFGLWTLSVGINVNGQLGPINLQVSGGVGLDSSGNIGLLSTGGGGLGVGGNASGGLNLSLSNARTICGLGGPFVNAGVGGGAGVDASVDQFYGVDRAGRTVGGAGLTFGPGVGAGFNTAITFTNVAPISGRKQKCQ